MNEGLSTGSRIPSSALTARPQKTLLFGNQEFTLQLLLDLCQMTCEMGSGRKYSRIKMYFISVAQLEAGRHTQVKSSFKTIHTWPFPGPIRTQQNLNTMQHLDLPHVAPGDADVGYCTLYRQKFLAQ